jgi:predicted nuclease with TOPRIM domain
MNNIFEANAPDRFPTPKEQPPLVEDSIERTVIKNPPVKETVNRWRKEVIDKIQYLRENWEQTNQEKEALSQEVDHLQSELAESKERIKALELQLSEALATFNGLLSEVSLALEK